MAVADLHVSNLAIEEHPTSPACQSTRPEGHDVSDMLGERSATVLHLHAHTKGLDELIDDLASE